MRIVSRPEEMVAGEGPYTLRMTFEELQLIGALIYNIRLGDGTYKAAAFQLMSTIEDLFDEEFIQEASSDVDFSVTVEDDRGRAISVYHNSDICIEV